MLDRQTKFREFRQFYLVKVAFSWDLFSVRDVRNPGVRHADGRHHI